MRRRWVWIGAALVGGGVAGVSMERAHHNECITHLGSFGSLMGDLAQNCAVNNTLFFVAIGCTIVGLTLLAAALLIRT